MDFQIDQVKQGLDALNLKVMSREFQSIAYKARQEAYSYEQFLFELVSQEVMAKSEMSTVKEEEKELLICLLKYISLIVKTK